MKKYLLLSALCLLFFAPHKAHAQTVMESCQVGHCYGYGPPSGPSQNGYIYQDVSQSPPALYCPKNGAWVACIVPSPSPAIADYNFLQGTGTVLADISGNNNNATLLTGGQAPTWLSNGLSFTSDLSSVQLPSAVNNATTYEVAAYIASPTIPIISTPNNSPNFLVTSSLGVSGFNLESDPANTPGYYTVGVYANGKQDVATGLIAGYHVIVHTCSTTAGGDKVWVDGNPQILTRNDGVCGQQTSGNLFLGSSVAALAGQGFVGTMYRFRALSGSVTDAQAKADTALINAQEASLGVSLTPLVIPNNTAPLNIIGDSISCSWNGTTCTPSFGWMSQMVLTNQPTYTTTNWSIYGINLRSHVANIPVQAATNCTSSSGPGLAILFAGTNDLNSFTPTGVTQILAASIQELKAAGCRVFVGTMINRGGTGLGISFDVLEQQYNALILSSAKGLGADAVIDFAANPVIGAAGANANTTYFQGDGVHPNATGQALMAAAASNALNYYFGFTAAIPHILTASATLASGDRAVEVGTLAGNIALVMPDCTGPSGETYTISNPQSAHTVTVAGGITAQPINGLTSAITIPSNSTVTLRDIANPKAVSGCHWAM